MAEVRRFLRKAGLTLIEVLIAMTILASTLSGFLAVFMMNQRTVGVANNQQQAMNQARGVMEDLFSHAYYDTALSVGNHAVDGRCAYTVSESNSMKRVAVRVTWTNALERQASSFVLTSALSYAIHR
jgi:prepilin-type N-terminal cleavage/methylation domain-containing protein